VKGYLENRDIHAISDATLGLFRGYDAATRAVLHEGLPGSFVGMMAAGGAPPAVLVRQDLMYLNTVQRLRDGSIPLKVWLTNALALSTDRAEAEPLRRALEEVEIKSTGAPRLDIVDAAELKEVVVHHDDMLPFEYMRVGLTVAQAIAKLSVTRFSGGVEELGSAGGPLVYLGTGWLIAPTLLITNHHVVNARDEGEADATELDLTLQAGTAKAQFDYDGENALGKTVVMKELVAWCPALDYALMRLEDTGRVALRIGPKLADTNNAKGYQALNIIQHPDGKPKKFAIRNNLLTGATQTELRYFTDTAGGSSGSPVLNDRWEVVGLHRGATRVTGVRFNGQDVAYVNVGSQINAIKSDLSLRYASRIPELGI
jgi:endonuclease G, mitochondrial